MVNVDREGKKMNLKLTIQDRTKVFASNPRVAGESSEPDAAPGKVESTQVKFGISIRPASDEELTMTPDKRGVTVTRVEPSSFADDIGMQERDVIVSINRATIASVEDIRKVQQSLKTGDPVAFRVVRQIAGVRAKNAQPATRTLFLSGTLPQN